jgi:hypothetical protein
MTQTSLLRLFLASLGALAAVIPQTSIAQQSHPVDVGGAFTYVRTNIVSGCNCFNTYGGSGEVQVGLSPHFAILGDVTVTHQGSITPAHYALTQTVFTAGLRYTPVAASSRFHIQPFGDLLVGGANASGSLSPSNTGYGSAGAFAFQTGGGLRIPVGHRLSIVPVQTEYLLTTFGNSGDDRQNDLRLSTGLMINLRR